MKIHEYNQMMAYLTRPIRVEFSNGGQAIKEKNIQEAIAEFGLEALNAGAKKLGYDNYKAAVGDHNAVRKIKNHLKKYGQVLTEFEARIFGRKNKTATDKLKSKLPKTGAKIVKGDYQRDYSNAELRNLAEEGLYDPYKNTFSEGVPKKQTVTNRIVDIEFADPKIKEEFMKDFKKRYEGTRATSGKRGVDNAALYKKYLSNLTPKTAELALAGLQSSMAEKFGDDYRYKTEGYYAKATKTSDAYLERMANDPQYLKKKARDLANLSTSKGKGLGILQHMYPKRMGDALNKLAIDTTNITKFSEAESILQNLDFEKSKLMNDPIKNKRRIDEIQAIENRIVKGKTVPEITTMSRRVNQYEPIPETKYNVKFDRPGQKGFYGFEKIDTDTLSSKLKGADLSKSVAGLSNEVIDKISFKNAPEEKAKKIIKKLSTKLIDRGEIKFKASAIPGLETLIKTVSSMPDDIKAKRYWTAGLKGLGIAAAPLVVYDGYTAIKEGLPPDEVIARAALGADKILYKGKEILQLTPEEKEARSLIKQDKLKDLNEDQMMGFGFIEGPEVDSDLSLEEAEVKLKEGQDRYADFREERDAARASQRAGIAENIRDNIFGVSLDDITKEYYNQGGRVGFAEGPKDPSKRLFIKGLAALSVLPIVGKYFKLAKSPTAVKAVETAIEKVSGMPDWFQPFVNKVLKMGDDVTDEAATIEREIVKRVDIEDATVDVHYNTATNDVRVEVFGGNKTALDQPLELNYKAPEVIEETGKKTKGEFKAVESKPEAVQTGPDDYDFEAGENVTDVLDDLLSETDYLEGFATGKIRTPAEIKRAKNKAFHRRNMKEDPAQYILEEDMGNFSSPDRKNYETITSLDEIEDLLTITKTKK